MDLSWNEDWRSFVIMKLICCCRCCLPFGFCNQIRTFMVMSRPKPAESLVLVSSHCAISLWNWHAQVFIKARSLRLRAGQPSTSIECVAKILWPTKRNENITAEASIYNVQVSRMDFETAWPLTRRRTKGRRPVVCYAPP